MAFRSWQDFFFGKVEIWALQLPGRSARLHEPPFTQMQPLVDAVAEQLLPWLDRPFAFFGHSMGATLSFEVACKLRGEQNLEPRHLFVSGRRAPHRPSPPPIYHLPEPEFIERLRSLNGTPDEVLDHQEFLQLLMPMLRADFEVIETYKHIPRPALQCPITALGGLRDENVGQEHLNAWNELTVGPFSMHMFSGNHFFLNSEQKALLQVISNELQPLLGFVGNQPQSIDQGNYAQ